MPRQAYNKTMYNELNDFVFGSAMRPVRLGNGIEMGSGIVYPEINFTLPPMLITKDTMPEVIRNYKEMITGICDRARELNVDGFITEIETLPPMTERPEWGIEVCKAVIDTTKKYEGKYGIKIGVRITPNDIREGDDLEHMWHGRHFDCIMKTFEGCALAGADLLSIESIGGKEVHDDAVIYCDISKSIFALSILGCADMSNLWDGIVSIADRTGTIAAGDTACGFANTAMVLAEKQYIPRVFAATVRVMSAVRSLVAMERGAVGPHKDCGYEGVYVKAISGIPISMEGRTAACAHLTPIGNISACVADLWSNESVQNIKMLSAMAPTVSFEQLVYDCRLMNTATSRGHDTALMLRDLHSDSDSSLDPQAYILRPDVVLDIAKGIVKVDGHYNRTRKAAILALNHLTNAYDNGRLSLVDRELAWLEKLSDIVVSLPNDPDEFTQNMVKECSKLDPSKYDILGHD